MLSPVGDASQTHAVSTTSATGLRLPIREAHGSTSIVPNADGAKPAVLSLAQIPASSQAGITLARPEGEPQQIHPEIPDREFFAGRPGEVEKRFEAFAKSEPLDAAAVPQRMESVLRACAKHNIDATPQVFRIIVREYLPHTGANATGRMRTLMGLMDLMVTLHEEALNPNPIEYPTAPPQHAKVDVVIKQLCRQEPAETRVYRKECKWCIDEGERAVEAGFPFGDTPITLPQKLQHMRLVWAMNVAAYLPIVLLHRDGVPLRPVAKAAWFNNADTAAALNHVQEFIDQDLACIRAYAKDGTFIDPAAMPHSLPGSVGAGICARALHMFKLAGNAGFQDMKGLATILKPYLAADHVRLDGREFSFVNGRDSVGRDSGISAYENAAEKREIDKIFAF